MVLATNDVVVRLVGFVRAARSSVNFLSQTSCHLKLRGVHMHTCPGADCTTFRFKQRIFMFHLHLSNAVLFVGEAADKWPLTQKGVNTWSPLQLSCKKHSDIFIG